MKSQPEELAKEEARPREAEPRDGGSSIRRVKCSAHVLPAVLMSLSCQKSNFFVRLSRGGGGCQKITPKVRYRYEP